MRQHRRRGSGRIDEAIEGNLRSRAVGMAQGGSARDIASRRQVGSDPPQLFQVDQSLLQQPGERLLTRGDRQIPQGALPSRQEGIRQWFRESRNRGEDEARSLVDIDPPPESVISGGRDAFVQLTPHLRDRSVGSSGQGLLRIVSLPSRSRQTSSSSDL